VLRAVEGRAGTEAVPGITGVTITIPFDGVCARSRRDRNLGFVFAEAGTPDDVEQALTAAQSTVSSCARSLIGPNDPSGKPGVSSRSCGRLP
jgi:hypothetical protein